MQPPSGTAVAFRLLRQVRVPMAPSAQASCNLCSQASSSIPPTTKRCPSPCLRIWERTHIPISKTNVFSISILQPTLKLMVLNLNFEPASTRAKPSSPVTHFPETKHQTHIYTIFNTVITILKSHRYLRNTATLAVAVTVHCAIVNGCLGIFLVFSLVVSLAKFAYISIS